MKGFAAACALALTLTTASVARADLLPDGGVTADEVASALKAKGYRAEIQTGDDGDPVILSGAEGSNFRVFFYTCRKGPRCAAIQFMAAFDLEKGMSLGDINAWNRDKRFGRAYLDNEMDPFIEMDVDFEHGATSEAVANAIDTWVAVLPAFREYVGF